MENKQTRTFIKGAAILGAAGIICKIIGAVYRIPLTNLIGAEAMGIYSKAYMIYSLLLVLTTSGIPAAVSKLVAEYAAAADYRNAKRTLQLTRSMLLAVGGICALIMLLLSDIIARSLGISDGGMVIICIAPSLLLTAVSAYRGYFQGLQNMVPTAVSQIIGQLSKLAVGFSLAAILLPRGPVYAASGALLGVSLSEGLSLLYLALKYRASKKNALPVKPGSLAGKSNKELLRSLLILAVPLTVGGAIMPLINTLDAYLATWCLKLSGYSETQINSMYGVLSGMVVSLANMPTALTLALSASLVPAISRARTQKNGREISRTASLGLKLALIIGLPACIGLIMLARPILELLYTTSPADQSALEITVHTLHSPYHFVFMQMDLAESLMLVMCPAMLLLTSVQAMTGALQGAGKIYIPIKNLLIGAGVKLVFSAVLISIPAINILGAPLGTLACYLTAFILDYIQLRKRLHAGVDAGFLLKPLFAAAVMALILYIIKLLTGGNILHPLITIAAVCAGAVIYLGILLLIRPFSVKELALIRGPKARGHASYKPLVQEDALLGQTGTQGLESASQSGNEKKAGRRERLGEFVPSPNSPPTVSSQSSLEPDQKPVNPVQGGQVNHIPPGKNTAADGFSPGKTETDEKTASPSEPASVLHKEAANRPTGVQTPAEPADIADINAPEAEPVKIISRLSGFFRRLKNPFKPHETEAEPSASAPADTSAAQEPEKQPEKQADISSDKERKALESTEETQLSKEEEKNE